MSQFRKTTILTIIILSMFVVTGTLAGENAMAQKPKIKKIVQTNLPPPEYKLLFFRNDHRVWILMPPKTTEIVIFRSDGTRKGYIRCLNRYGKIIAQDNSFEGDVIFSTGASKPSLKKDRLVVSKFDGNAVGIYTPEDAAYIEVLNSRNGFDGVVTILDKKKRILNRQSGLDLQILDY